MNEQINGTILRTFKVSIQGHFVLNQVPSPKLVRSTATDGKALDTTSKTISKNNFIPSPDKPDAHSFSPKVRWGIQGGCPLSFALYFPSEEAPRCCTTMSRRIRQDIAQGDPLRCSCFKKRKEDLPFDELMSGRVFFSADEV